MVMLFIGVILVQIFVYEFVRRLVISLWGIWYKPEADSRRKEIDASKDPLEVLSDVWIGLSDFNKRNKEKKGGINDIQS